MKKFRWIGTAFALALIACSGTAEAEVNKSMTVCDQKLCPHYEIGLKPPQGWVIEEKASRKLNVQVIVPEGKNFDTAPAVIYVQIFYRNDKEQSQTDFARASNERWRAQMKDAKISELPTVERTNGKPGFLRFAFENPRQKQQAYELGAFGIDSDKDGNEYFLNVVMSAYDKDVLDRAENDYISFLKAN